ncbi:MAG: zinc metallopeptidase, partial [Myxococcales bacterium]|nr:zinc metallopeptidase [Myxococcales bacterium]
ATHEAGHAIQHATNYAPLSFRSLVVKHDMIGSNLGMAVVMVGALVNFGGLIWLGIAMFSAFVLFTLITLPVEFNASSRAVAVLEQTGMINRSESGPTRAVLNAAALTYVAAAISAILTLLYLLWRAGVIGGSSRD